MRIRRSQTPSEADLAAYADGSIPASRRIRVERAVSESPRLKAVVAAQRRALGAIDQVSDEPAPAALRARLALAHPPPRARLRAWPAGLAAASVMAGVVAAVVVVITAGGSGGHPTVVQASRLALRPAEATVAGPSGQGQTLPGVTEAGLTYPYLEDQFGYKAVGVRLDRFAGRTATTVLYSRGGERMAYEIIWVLLSISGREARRSRATECSSGRCTPRGDPSSPGCGMGIRASWWAAERPSR